MRRAAVTGMQFLCRLLLLGVFVLTAGCRRIEDSRYLTPIPEATLAAHRIGSPVETRLDAVIAGRKLLESQQAKWVDTPMAALVEEMTYAEANGRIWGSDPQDGALADDEKVWLVIFQGRWQLTPLDPNGAALSPVTYEGCLMTVLTARDGGLVSMGDAVCPTRR